MSNTENSGWLESEIMFEALIKNRRCRVTCILLGLLFLFAAIAAGGGDHGDILTSAERNWLTANQSRIILAVETGYPPFVFIDSKDQPGGLAHDYMLLLESKLGTHFKQRQFSSLDEIFAKLRIGEVHVVNAVTKTPSRSEFLSFTAPFITVPNIIVVRKERAGKLSEEGLSGLKVSLVKSYAVTEHLTKKGLGLEPDLVPDDLTALYNVSFGRSDAAVIDLATASYLIAQKSITNLRVAGETSLDIRLSIGVPRADSMLQGILQKGLNAITEAERNEIRNRWINASGHSIFSDRRFWPAVAGVFLLISGVIAAILVWNRMLRRQVIRRTKDLLALKDVLQEQNEELQMNEESLREQNDELQVTEEMLRVQMEEYEVSQKLLKDSEEKYRELANEQQIILNTSSVGIILAKNRKVVWANPAHCKMFGYEIGETINMDTVVYYVDKESHQYVGEKGYSILASGGIFSEDLMMKKKDGTEIWCNLVGQAVTPHNMDNGAIWIILDITARKQAEEERRQLEQQFQQAQKLESLGMLAGGIAHDFNNILTVIQGHCYMVREDMLPPEGYKEAFGRVEAATNRAADLCRQMLTYAGKSPLEQTRVNLWLLVDEVVKMLQSALKKNIAIELDLRRDVPEINGDSGQIQQIVMNLIINAAEAIGDSSGSIRVALTKTVMESDQEETDTLGTVIDAGRYACLEVTDTGCGMDEETQKRIFEPFYTTKFTGRGLGMSVICGIMKSHGGLLSLSSKPGFGTTFKVCFPVALVADDIAATPSAETIFEKSSGTILLVEDEETLRRMGADLLEAMGFAAIVAQNGREAVDIYRERGSGIDLILLDLIMPVMGGIEAYHELRQINPAVPIIISSGYGIESISDVIKRDQHAGFVQKPYKPGRLREVMVGMMGTSIGMTDLTQSS